MAKDQAKLKVPAGFRNLLECLTLEILRVQPTNISTFAAHYLKGRLVAREEKGYDECLLGSQIDGFYKYEPFNPERTSERSEAPSNEQSDIPSKEKPEAPGNEQSEAPNNELSDVPSNEPSGIPSNEPSGIPSNEPSGIPSNEPSGIPSNETSDVPSNSQPQHRVVQYDDRDLAASKIQAGFHGYRCRQQIKAQHQAARRIQAGYRGYACRQDLKHKNEAATKIQTEFRGSQVRKGIVGNTTSNVVPRDSNGDAGEQTDIKQVRDRKEIARQSKAATTIQAGYRGYRVRRVRRAQSKAAIKIQSNYRGYRVRKYLKGTRTQSLAERRDMLEILQFDSRSSFSLPVEDVKFEGNLDSDSDSDIDKAVQQLEAKQKATPDDEKSKVYDDNQV